MTSKKNEVSICDRLHKVCAVTASARRSVKVELYILNSQLKLDHGRHIPSTLIVSDYT